MSVADDLEKLKYKDLEHVVTRAEQILPYEWFNRVLDRMHSMETTSYNLVMVRAALEHLCKVTE